MAVATEKHASNPGVTTMLKTWQKQLDKVNQEYDQLVDHICALQLKLDDAETQARQLLTKQTELEKIIAAARKQNG